MPPMSSTYKPKVNEYATSSADLIVYKIQTSTPVVECVYLAVEQSVTGLVAEIQSGEKNLQLYKFECVERVVNVKRRPRSK